MFTVKGSSITEADTVVTKHLCFKHADTQPSFVRSNEAEHRLCNVQKNRGYAE